MHLIFSGKLCFAFLTGNFARIAFCHQGNILVLQFIENHDQNAEDCTDCRNQHINGPQRIQRALRLGYIECGQFLKAFRFYRHPLGKTQQEQAQRGRDAATELIDKGVQREEDAGTILAGFVAGVLYGVRSEKCLCNLGNIAWHSLKHQKHGDHRKIVIAAEVD